MYDASRWHEVRTLAELTAADAAAHPGGVRLLVDASSAPEDLSALPASEHLGRVAVLQIDGDVRVAADAILRSPHLTAAHTVVLGDVWWGDYSPDVSPYGWQEHALSEALDMLFARATFERLVCRGSLPSYDDGEYGGTLGFVLISDWWRGLRGLELDTRALQDDFLRRIDQFPELRSLRVASPLLTDASTELLSHQGSCFDRMEEFECEGYLISRMGWEWVYDASWLPEHLQDHFDALASAPEKTWAERFGDVRSLTQDPMDVAVFHVVLDQLSKLREEDPARYDAELLPHLAALARGVWPPRIEFVFGDRQSIGRLERAATLLPFLGFDVRTADPSWSMAKWAYLYESDALGSVRSVEAFNHNLTVEEGEAMYAAEGFSGLESLRFSTQHELPIEALIAWLSSPHLRNLERLEVTIPARRRGWGTETVEGMRCGPIVELVAGLSHLTSLRHLVLRGTHDPASLRVFAGCARVASLESLDFGDLDDACEAALLASPHLSDAVRAQLAGA